MENSIHIDHTVNKTTFSFSTFASLIVAAVAAKVNSVIDSQAPVGYEDETGFHYGKPS